MSRKSIHPLRYLMLPFSAVHAAVLKVRNTAYDRGWKKSFAFEIPTIVVGNLSMGGTGKSPHVEYLIRLLGSEYKIATLSRGYGRRTRGYIRATHLSHASDIGDEPLQFKRRFPDLEVAVCEERIVGVASLLGDVPELDLIILDDAFQHRRLKAGLNILLTTKDKPWSKDHLFPVGSLRESASGANKADLVVVSKCPDNMPISECEALREELAPPAGVNCFFSGLKYGKVRDLWTGKEHRLQKSDNVILLSGIADASPLKKYLEQKVILLRHIEYGDHHSYKVSDIKRLSLMVKKSETETLILTTTKDAGRLLELKAAVSENKLRILTIDTNVYFLSDTQRPDADSRFDSELRIWASENVGKWRSEREFIKE